MRNRFLALAVTLVVAGLCSVTAASAQTAAPPTRRPDVIFVPTPEAVVEAMLQVANVTKNDIVYDLGCGDGRIPVTAAKKYGARGVGIDIDPQRIKEANENVQKNGVGDKVKIMNADLFTTRS
jgi:methylase of polypeptide subunit release factors